MDINTKIICTTCRVETKHSVEKSTNTSDTSDDGEIIVWGTYEILKCLGCEEISFRATTQCSEEIMHDEQGNTILQNKIYVYPARPARDSLFQPRHHLFIPNTIRKIYKDTCTAYDNTLLSLTAIGLRLIVETTCTDLKSKGATLEQKINFLVSNGKITQVVADQLHHNRLLGNGSAHKGDYISVHQADLAFKIIEIFLLSIYSIPEEMEVANWVASDVK